MGPARPRDPCAPLGLPVPVDRLAIVSDTAQGNVRGSDGSSVAGFARFFVHCASRDVSGRLQRSPRAELKLLPVKLPSMHGHGHGGSPTEREDVRFRRWRGRNSFLTVTVDSVQKTASSFVTAGSVKRFSWTAHCFRHRFPFS